MRTYADRPPGQHEPQRFGPPLARAIPIRRWPRRILLSVNIFTLLCLLTVGTVYGYAKLKLGQIKIINDLPLHHSGNSLAPMNILLVGDNSRVGLSPAEAAKFGTADDAGGAHSDVTMLLHLNPSTGAASLLSIPRDLFVPLPPNNISGSVGKIDSALNGSNFKYSDGAAQLISTIQNDLGIPIDHYVQINFDGFQQTVNALGGINLYFPTLLFDAESTLRTYQTGCLHLSGQTTLALVRARHLQYYVTGDNPHNPRSWPQENQSDLARIQRDHTFLKVLASSVKSQGVTADLVKVNDIISALINQVSIDSGLKSLLIPLVKRFRGVNLDSVPLLTLPVSVVPGAQYHYGNGAYGTVDFPVQPVDSQVIAQWQGASIPKVSPSSVTVQVRNISNVTHQAANLTSGLNALGFTANNDGQGPVPSDAVETLVRYHPGAHGLEQAQTVVQALAGSVMMKSDPGVADGIVEVDAGTSVAVVTATAANPSSAAAGSSQASTSTTAPVVNTPGGQPVSSATDQLASWDPVACKPGQPVSNG